MLHAPLLLTPARESQEWNEYDRATSEGGPWNCEGSETVLAAEIGYTGALGHSIHFAQVLTTHVAAILPRLLP